jgi:hypothetical protein
MTGIIQKDQVCFLHTQSNPARNHGLSTIDHGLSIKERFFFGELKNWDFLCSRAQFGCARVHFQNFLGFVPDFS